MADVYKRLFKNVAANTTETLSYVVPNGVTLQVIQAKAHASASPDTVCVIDWDNEATIIFSSHGNSSDDMEGDVEVVGDGAKAVRIRLINNQSVSDYLGCSWRGFEV